ncbi:MAG: glycosyltransferase family 4 protein [Pirellulaceae bacterium]
MGTLPLPTDDPSKIALLIHSLSGGGAERVVADLANTWVSAGRCVTLVTMTDSKSDRYDVSPEVRRVALALDRPSKTLWQGIWNNWRRVRAIRRALRESGAELAISFVDRMNITTLCAADRLKIPVVVCERTDYRHHSIGKFWDRQRRRWYPTAATLVVQTEEVAGDARDWLTSVPIEVIPNAVPQSAITSSPRVQSGAARTITWIGRMAEEKGVAELIDAFGLAARDLPDWTLALVGDGPLRGSLEARVNELNVGDQVQFHGWQRDLGEVYDRTTFFALPSRYEGFPNVLLECMARGIPAISFDCPSGPRAIIRDNVDGLLVAAGDVAQFSAAIVQLAKDPERLERLGLAAAEVRERFGREQYLRRWEDVLEKTTGPGNLRR